MKKIYIIPTASFEPLEDEDFMIGASVMLQDKTVAGGNITKNNPNLGGDLEDISGGNTGGIFEDDGETDD